MARVLVTKFFFLFFFPFLASVDARRYFVAGWPDSTFNSVDSVFSAIFGGRTAAAADPKPSNAPPPSAPAPKSGTLPYSDAKTLLELQPHSRVSKWPEEDSYVLKRDQIWDTRIIPYTLSDEFTPTERRIVIGAITEVQSKTCLRFVERTNETDYVRFLKKEAGCFSHVGRQSGEQWVNLSNDSACVRHALVVHELMHVLGWFHEHSRPDRDEHIKIYWHNILDDYRDNFKVFDNEQIFAVQILPYDYHSVTHYHSSAFSRISLLPTIVSWNDRQLSLGNNRGLSPGDVQKLRRGYACDRLLKGPQPEQLMASASSNNFTLLLILLSLLSVC